MSFENQKKTFLSKLDKSKKGGIDRDILPLINKINKSKNYYTTSSCSGRVVLLSQKLNQKKGAKWLFISHKKVSFKEIKKALEKLPKTDIWLRFEPFILHVAPKDLESAQELVNKARDIGFKRTGIQSTRKIVIEIASTEIISTIIAEKGNLLVDNNYLKILIREANKKLEKNREKIKRFYDSI